MKLEGVTLTDASLLIGLGRFDEAELALIELLDAADADGDDAAASQALEGLGTVATRRGQEPRALELFEQALERGRHPDPAERDGLYWNTARLRSYTGDADGAVALLEECLTRLSSRPQPDRALVSHFAITLNYAYADAGEYGKARTLLADVLQHSEDLDLEVQRGSTSRSAASTSTPGGPTWPSSTPRRCSRSRCSRIRPRWPTPT